MITNKKDLHYILYSQKITEFMKDLFLNKNTSLLRMTTNYDYELANTDNYILEYTFKDSFVTTKDSNLRTIIVQYDRSENDEDKLYVRLIEKSTLEIIHEVLLDS